MMIMISMISSWYEELCYTVIHEKVPAKSIFSPNIDRFWQFFHQRTLRKTCNNCVIKFPTPP